MNEEKSWPVPSWAKKYRMSDNVAICLDKFACRGRPSLSMLNVDDINRLKNLKHALDIEGRSIEGKTIESILLSEFDFTEKDAKYIANFYDDVIVTGAPIR